MKEYTVSAHNGTAVSREHNRRNRAYTQGQDHIDPNGLYEVWIDEPIREAYQRLFGHAQAQYNAKARPDRQITDYYTKVKASRQQHPAYEIIFTIGNKKAHPDPKVARGILRRHLDDFMRRNPALEVIGAYYHADEQGAPHLHIDYVPVARGYTRGMSTQTGLNRALEQQGTLKDGKLTPQMVFQTREREALKTLCQAKGWGIAEPERKRQQHIKTQQFKELQELKAIERKVQSLRIQQNVLEQQTREIQALRRLAEELKAIKAFMQRIAIKGISIAQLWQDEQTPGFINRIDKADILSMSAIQYRQPGDKAHKSTPTKSKATDYKKYINIEDL